jgi:hypothetical protein
VVRAAKRNAELPIANRLKGDPLTVYYCREAARAATRLPTKQAAAAYLLALGLALDDSQILRKNPLTADLCRRVESDAERRERLAVLGSPTMLDRRDWCQHFVVSCTLTQVVGEPLAEAAGLFKEQLDSQPGGSGFSFADLSADLAGVAFAMRLQRGQLSLEKVASGFLVTDFVPDAKGLREGLSAEQFARDYGSTDDKRFQRELAGLRQRIRDLPGHNGSSKP